MQPFAIALFAVLAFGARASSPQSSTTTRKTANHRAKATSTAKQGTASRKRPVAVVHRPQQPSPDRYKEIQQALADRGYFNKEPDGNWGATSIDALKRFQHDQKLTEDGKIGSLSLIALGLGPKREIAETEQKTP